MPNRLWKYISSIGVKDEYDDILVKRITLINQFTVVAIFIFLFSGLNNLVLGDVFSGSIIECLVPVCFFSFYLNSKGHHRFSISLLFSLLSCALFYFDSYSGLLSGTYLFHFPLILAIAFVFDMREDKKYMITHFSIIIIFLLFNIVTKRDVFKSNFLTDDARAQMFIFNLLFSAFSVGFFIYQMIQNNLKENYRYIKRIEDKRNSEILIKEALAEKNILISELHHRVKNNLAIISGLFSLKITEDLHEDAKNVLIESRNRVRSMALIHNLLYKNDNLISINFNEYAQELISEIYSSYPLMTTSVAIKTQINNVFLNVNNAIPCGLILNELLTNCFKYAFKDRASGEISIVIEDTNNLIKMLVKDDGVGLPAGYDKKQSLGITVIEALSEQLDGNYNLSSDQGTLFELTFKNI